MVMSYYMTYDMSHIIVLLEFEIKWGVMMESDFTEWRAQNGEVKSEISFSNK